MWNPEFTAGAVALLRIPAQSFGDGGSELPAWRYRELPRVRGYDFHDRFVGDYVLYGTGSGWGAPSSGNGMVVAASIHGDVLTELPLDHGVDRIEAMGRDAAVIGSDEERLTFTAVELTAGREPVIGDRYSLQAAQGETRSHAFFFLPDDGADKSDDGVLGLPVARPARPAYHQLFENSAAMLFIRRKDRQFNHLGELDAQTDGVSDDNCRASCVDWYGNARPIFVFGRTFALLGYELVEGAMRDGVMQEVSRVSYAPKPPAQRAPS
jgi:hypothetical protein